MTSIPAFERIYAKVIRAEQHIQDFQFGLEAFLRSNPYQISVNKEPDGDNGSYFISELPPISHALEAIASDVVNNLRTALDNLAYHLVSDALGGTEPDWKVYFPIAGSATDYRGTRGGCIKSVRQEIIDAFNETEAYRGGKGHGFWQMNELANSEKHRVPLGFSAAFRSVDISVDFENAFRKMPGFEQFRMNPLLLNLAARNFPAKLGDVLFWGPAQTEVANNRRFAFHVSINKPDVIADEPAIETLKSMSNLVSNTLKAFERFV